MWLKPLYRAIYYGGGFHIVSMRRGGRCLSTECISILIALKFRLETETIPRSVSRQSFDNVRSKGNYPDGYRCDSLIRGSCSCPTCYRLLRSALHLDNIMLAYCPSDYYLSPRFFYFPFLYVVSHARFRYICCPSTYRTSTRGPYFSSFRTNRLIKYLLNRTSLDRTRQ